MPGGSASGPDDYDDPPRSLFCPMDPADLPQAKADEPPADADFEEDVTTAEQALTQATDNVDEIIRDIAKQHLKFEGDLVNFYGNDDFMSAGFPWDSIRQALFAAYQAEHDAPAGQKLQQLDRGALPHHPAGDRHGPQTPAISE